MDDKSSAMQKEMDETLADLTAKLGKMEQQVSGTVNSVKESVNTVRESLDLRHHVRRRPWTLLAGASAVGFIGGYRPTRVRRKVPAPGTQGLTEPPRPADSPVHGHAPVNGGSHGAPSDCIRAKTSTGWLANMGKKFEPEIAELKGVVVGTLLALARELILKQALKPTKPPGKTAPDGQPHHTDEQGR